MRTCGCIRITARRWLWDDEPGGGCTSSIGERSIVKGAVWTRFAPFPGGAWLARRGEASLDLTALEERLDSQGKLFHPQRFEEYEHAGL